MHRRQLGSCVEIERKRRWDERRGKLHDSTTAILLLPPLSALPAGSSTLLPTDRRGSVEERRRE